ncbi:unnamed protein product [Diatraea saccharalis]|uniref:ATP-dependent (S)-NAD(P)H-hydrate dehydratase n=1 Tax=Diatraea saccharalis TaxID=40085 RepID=A0A9N9WJ25_9NEOP|nr:unnamed protein product [Diatraea saccharalis]
MLKLSNTSNILHYFTKVFTNVKRYKMEQASMIEFVKKCIPTLDDKKHKGQAGRIGIVGGSMEYTGAPYFAGISALKVGADLVHIFCTSSAAIVIKSYSPELIVHPLLDKDNAIVTVSPWLDRLHAVVIGPGLGREPNIFDVVAELIKIIEDKKIPLVIDADGLFLISNKPELLKNFSSPVILTPNKIEYDRLCNSIGEFNQQGSNIVILRKGCMDELYSSEIEVQWKFNLGGSGRRCGGQGDLLSGSIATFLHWMLENINAIDIQKEHKNLTAVSLSCFAASILIRKCNEKTYKIKGRSMLASDMIDHLHEAFEELFGK